MAHERERRLAHPVEVLDHEHCGASPRHTFDEAGERGEGLLAVGLARRQTEQRAKAAQDPLIQLGIAHCAGQLVLHGLGAVTRDDAGLRAHDLPQRPEREAFPIRRAASLSPVAQEALPIVDEAEELVHEARLADPGLAGDQRELRRVRGDRSVEQAGEDTELDLAADHVGLVAPPISLDTPA